MHNLAGSFFPYKLKWGHVNRQTPVKLGPWSPKFCNDFSESTSSPPSLFGKVSLLCLKNLWRTHLRRLPCNEQVAPFRNYLAIIPCFYTYSQTEVHLALGNEVEDLTSEVAESTMIITRFCQFYIEIRVCVRLGPKGARTTPLDVQQQKPQNHWMRPCLPIWAHKADILYPMS